MPAPKESYNLSVFDCTHQYSKLPSLQFSLERVFEGLELGEALAAARGLMLPPECVRSRHIELAREEKLDGSSAGYARRTALAQRV